MAKQKDFLSLTDNFGYVFSGQLSPGCLHLHKADAHPYGGECSEGWRFLHAVAMSHYRVYFTMCFAYGMSIAISAYTTGSQKTQLLIACNLEKWQMQSWNGLVEVCGAETGRHCSHCTKCW